MNATDELRRLLDERGVEHHDGPESTLFLKDERGYRASVWMPPSGELSVHIWCDTPEQAIAATLGRGTCKNRDADIYPGGMVFVCSACEGMSTDGQPSYCPNCGAKVVSE